MSLHNKMTIKDYKNILNYYDIGYSTLTNNAIKNKVHSILAKKLCKCIKKVQAKTKNKNKSKSKTNKSKNNKSKSEGEGRAIGICKNSVITKKNIKIFTFNCKKGAKLNPKKGTRKLKIVKI
jgi:hypothetical protein